MKDKDTTMVIDFTPMTTSVKRKAKFGATYPMEITFQKVRIIHGEKQNIKSATSFTRILEERLYVRSGGINKMISVFYAITFYFVQIPYIRATNIKTEL